MANPFKHRPPIKDAEHYPNLFRSVRTRRNRFWGRWYGWVAIGLGVLLIGGGGFGVWYYYSFQGALTREVPGVDPEAEGKPKNVLIVGSDSREGLTEEQKFRLGAADVGGERADTLIIAHIDPATNHVIMVQFPRDLYITRHDGTQERINAGLINGKSFLVESIENLTGLEMNAYAQVNIAGFRDLVDAIGGVEICLTEPIPFDSATGIEVTEDEVPGMVEFDGDRAISYVRSRKVFAEGDFARIQNQQRFLAAAIDKMLSAGTLLRPDRLLKIKDIAGDNVVVSRTLDLGEIRKLANQLSNVNPDTYEVYTAPHLGTTRLESGASVVLPDEPAMDYLFGMIAKNRSPSEDGVPDIPPNTIAVSMLNGTGVDGAATEAAQQLTEMTRDDTGEIRTPVIEDADRDNYAQTVIRYEARNEEKAEFIGAALPGAKLQVGRTGREIDVEVVVGHKFETQRIVQVTPIEIPEPGEVPPECA